MGILGLLQYVKGCLKVRRMSDYRGKTVAVDTYAWLHKIIKGPSGRDLILGGANRYRYVNDCLKRISRIQNLGIKVIMVFDGGPLPGKKQEQQSRRKRREQTFAKGKQMLENGDEAGFKKLVDSIDITPDIAFRLIIELKKKNIEFIVAPYEADAQLAYLSRQGIADVIITEDSDLMAFGAKRMLYKLDFATMMGCEMQIDEIAFNKQVNFTWFTHCMFLTTCILSGCDYLNQISGIGIKTAQKSIGRVTTFRGFLSQIYNKSLIPQDYETNFMKAFLTFRFQRVYCPQRRCCVQLNSFDNLKMSMKDMEQQSKKQIKWSDQVLNEQVMEYYLMNNIIDFSFLGEKYSDVLAQQIAEAEVHPTTYSQYDVNSSDSLTYVPTVPITMNSIVNNARQNNYSKTSKFGKRDKEFSKEANLMSKFLSQPNNKKSKSQKYNPFLLDYKSMKEGVDDQVYKLTQQELQNFAYQKSVDQFKPLKGGLKLTEDNQDIEQSEDQSANISYLQSQSLVEQISVREMQLAKPVILTVKSCKQNLEQFSESLFNQIFSQEYLKNPFSF